MRITITALSCNDSGMTDATATPASQIAEHLKTLGVLTITSQSHYLSGAAGISQMAAFRVLKGNETRRKVADKVAKAMASLGVTIDPGRVMYGTEES